MASMAMGYAFLENHLIGTAVDCGVGSMLTYKETQVITTKICLWGEAQQRSSCLVWQRSSRDVLSGETQWLWGCQALPSQTRGACVPKTLSQISISGTVWSLGLSWSRWLRCDYIDTDNLQAIKQIPPPCFSRFASAPKCCKTGWHLGLWINSPLAFSLLILNMCYHINIICRCLLFFFPCQKAACLCTAIVRWQKLFHLWICLFDWPTEQQSKR